MVRRKCGSVAEPMVHDLLDLRNSQAKESMGFPSRMSDSAQLQNAMQCGYDSMMVTLICLLRVRNGERNDTCSGEPYDSWLGLAAWIEPLLRRPRSPVG